MSRLADTYTSKVLPALRKELSIANSMAVPRVEKVVVNVGVGRKHKEADVLKKIEADLAVLTGQRPSARAARKSVASFKLREGVTVGYAVTLRGRRMWDFLDRFISIALPLSKDFRGIDEKNVDQHGNLNMGIREHNIFPEIALENIKDIFSLQITVTTTAQNREQGLALLKKLGIPFKK